MKKISKAIGLAAICVLLPSYLLAKTPAKKKPSPATQTTATQTLQQATDSIKNVLALAEKGDAVAQNEVGGWYYRGRHVNQNYQKALEWWSKSAKQGNAEAIGNMALCYQTGNGIEADSVKASQLYLTSIKKGNTALLSRLNEEAKGGNVFCNMLLASCYKNGTGVKRDPEKALPYLENAAKKNCVEAQRDLGLAYLNAKKPAEAAKWFKMGTDNGELTSTFYYGKMLIEGNGVKPDKKAGSNYMLKAAEAGFPQAMVYIGNGYMTGDGLTKNPDQAVKWYRLAAGKGAHNAQWELARCYREGVGTPVDYERALYWYAEAAAKGHERGFKNLVNDTIPDSPFVDYLKGMKAYSAGKYEDALKEFKIVDKAKINDAKIMEALIYANKENPKQDVKKAIKILKELTKTDVRADYYLGMLYEQGKGVEKDMPLAVKYITKAADSGYGAAECVLADMYYEGRGVDQDYAKAVALYAKAYADGELTENAAKRYALCYQDGKGGLEVDKKKAEEILKSIHKSPVANLLKNI